VRIRPRSIAVAALAATFALPASAGAWKYVFQDFFDVQGGAIAAGRAVAKKCGPGGKLGTYDYRSLVTSSNDAGELTMEVLAELSVRPDFKRMKKVEVNADATPNFPPQIVDEAAGALHDFHETVFTKFKDAGKHTKLVVRHGALVMFGNEVVAPGQSNTKFEPKPGC
jgi:hypothetical protein